MASCSGAHLTDPFRVVLNISNVSAATDPFVFDIANVSINVSTLAQLNDTAVTINRTAINDTLEHLNITIELLNLNDTGGAWDIVLNATDNTGQARFIDNTCTADLDGFQIVDITGCPGASLCTVDTTNGNATLTLGKGQGVNLSWTLISCSGAWARDPYNIVLNNSNGTLSKNVFVMDIANVTTNVTTKAQLNDTRVIRQNATELRITQDYLNYTIEYINANDSSGYWDIRLNSTDGSGARDFINASCEIEADAPGEVSQRLHCAGSQLQRE